MNPGTVDEVRDHVGMSLATRADADLKLERRDRKPVYELMKALRRRFQRGCSDWGLEYGESREEGRKEEIPAIAHS